MDTPNILGRPLAVICSDVRNDDANLPPEGMKRFITHLMRFLWGEQGSVRSCPKFTEGHRERKLAGFQCD